MNPPMKESVYLSWMHPSWRDLVIERLASDSRARTKFLSRCGMNGFLLAISGAGGASGKRRTPLLVTQKDWDAFGDTASRLIRSSNGYETWRLLTAVSDVVEQQLEGKSDQETTIGPPTSGLAEKVLDACREKWGSDDFSVSANGVASYFKISERLTPLPPSPRLDKIWEAFWSAAQDEIDRFSPSALDFWTSDFSDWLKLSATVLVNEPRFLRQVGFPAKYMEPLKSFLLELNERAELKAEPISDDECDDETGRLDELEEIGNLADESFGALQDDVAALHKAIRKSKLRLENARDAIKEAAEPEERGALKQGGAGSAGRSTSHSKETTSPVIRYVVAEMDNAEVVRRFDDL
jgi:hypothetical protein